MKRHPAKAFTGIAAMFLLGAIVAYLGGDDDDDDDKNAYYNLPEYVRRSNILFRAKQLGINSSSGRIQGCLRYGRTDDFRP